MPTAPVIQTVYTSHNCLGYVYSKLKTTDVNTKYQINQLFLQLYSYVRTSFGSRSFSVAAPKIWNSLPPALRMCTSHDTFRHQLKTHYFQLAFQPT